LKHPRPLFSKINYWLAKNQGNDFSSTHFLISSFTKNQGNDFSSTHFLISSFTKNQGNDFSSTHFLILIIQASLSRGKRCELSTIFSLKKWLFNFSKEF